MFDPHSLLESFLTNWPGPDSEKQLSNFQNLECILPAAHSDPFLFGKKPHEIERTASRWVVNSSVKTTANSQWGFQSRLTDLAIFIEILMKLCSTKTITHISILIKTKEHSPESLLISIVTSCLSNRPEEVETFEIQEAHFPKERIGGNKY